MSKKFLSDVLIECGLQVDGTTTLGTATATTVATSDNSTNIATTAWVKALGYSTTDSYISDVSLSGTSLSFTGINSAFTGSLDLSALTTELKDVETVYATVRNVSGVFIAKGTPLTTVIGQTSGNVSDVVPADAADPGLMPALFIADEDILEEQEGRAVAYGEITGIDTSLYPSGTTVYVAPGGGWTDVKPVGTNLIQNLGVITKQHNTNGGGIVTGVGRSNDVPNIPQGYAWVGNANGVATPTLLGSLAYSSATYDNYGSWNLKTNGVQRTTVQSGGNLDIVAGTDISVSYGAGGVVTINSTATGSIDYISDVALNGSSLDFTAVGSGFAGSIDLATLDIAPIQNVLGDGQTISTSYDTGSGEIMVTAILSSSIVENGTGLVDSHTVWRHLDTNLLNIAPIQNVVGDGQSITTSYDTGTGEIMVTPIFNNVPTENSNALVSSHGIWSYIDGLADNNNYITGLSFNTGNGVLTATRQGLGDLTVDLDGRYLTSYTETDTLATVTARGATTSTAVTFESNVTLGNSADLVFSDTSGTFPTSGKGFDWTLNNDGARIYAMQPSSDAIDFVFQLRDNATTNDRFVFHVKEWQGASYDKYPLIIRAGTQFDLVDSALYTNGTLRLSNTGALSNVSGNISMFTNDAGYLTSFTETDPIFSAHVSAGITGTQISNWDAAHSWGDHSAAGYLTSETLTELSLTTNILSYRDETGAVTELDLSLYLDDTNLARLTSGTLNGSTGIATFTRDDSSTFTVDFSAFLADGNNYADSLAFNTSTGVLTLGRNGSLSDLTVDLDGRYQGAGTYNTIIGTDADINTGGYTVIDQLTMTDGVITAHSTRSISQLYFEDTRNVADAPDHFDQELSLDFKNNSTIGNSLGNTYSGVMTIAPWRDPSGGWSHQLIFSSSGATEADSYIGWRVANPDEADPAQWSTIRKLATQEWVGSQNYLTTVAWNDVTGKPSTFTPSAHTHDASDIVSGTLDGARLPWASGNDGFTGTYGIVWRAGDQPWTASWLTVNGNTDTLNTRNISATGNISLTGTIGLAQGVNIDHGAGIGAAAGTIIETFDSALYIGAFLDFTIYNEGKDSMRSGTLQLVFNPAEVMFNEVNTMDIGDTTPCTLTAVNNGGTVEVVFTTPDPSFHIKYHVRTL